MTNERFSTVSLLKYGEDRWRAQLPYKDENGKWKKITRTLTTKGRDKGRSKRIENCAHDEAEALRKELNEQFQADENARNATAAEQVTVFRCVSSYLTSECVNVHRSTMTGYVGLLNRVIAPKLGEVPLSDLTRDDVQTWLDSLSNHYSRPVINNALRLLRAALNYAIDPDQGWITYNVALKARPKKQDQAPNTTPNALTDAEYARVLATVNAALCSDNGYRDLPHMLAIKIALLSGLRRAEICALQWRDIDFNEGSITVVRSVGHTDHEFYIKDPKSKTSTRTVECPRELMNDLSHRRAAMVERCQAAGVPFTGTLYVIGSIDGAFLKPPRLDDHWRHFSKNLSLHGTQPDKPITFHCLRHTYATILLQKGLADVATISKLLGHSKTSITLDRYASTGSQAKRRAADAMGDAITNIIDKHTHGNDDPIHKQDK